MLIEIRETFFGVPLKPRFVLTEEEKREETVKYFDKLWERNKLYCVHCGEKIISDDATLIHIWGRWENDNGYWCTKEYLTSADLKH